MTIGALNNRDIHHLIYPSLVAKKPVACAISYEIAVIVASDISRRAIVTLFVETPELGRCPVCEGAFCG